MPYSVRSRLKRLKLKMRVEAGYKEFGSKSRRVKGSSLSFGIFSWEYKPIMVEEGRERQALCDESRDGKVKQRTERIKNIVENMQESKMKCI